MRAFLEGNPGTREGFNQRFGLRLGAVEHGEIGKPEVRARATAGAATVDRKEAVTADQALDRSHHEFGFRPLGRRRMDGDVLCRPRITSTGAAITCDEAVTIVLLER